jgi:hypothetical protein
MAEELRHNGCSNRPIITITTISSIRVKPRELSWRILIKQVISLIEPMMILLMALIIGFIVVSMLLAIFSANDIAF